MSSLGEDFPKQQARVRELLVEYRKIGPAGAFSAMMIGAALAEAEKAAISGDVVAIMKAYKKLKDCE